MAGGRNVANNLTILRALLVPVFVTCLTYAAPDKPYFLKLAILTFLVACATDALDGYLARRLNQLTAFGAYMDPIADKLLLVSGFLSLTYMNHLPPEIRVPAWTTILVLARDLLILSGSGVVFMTTGRLKAEPLFTSKATTLVQMLTILLALVAAPEPLRNLFFGLTGILTVASGILYIRIGKRLIP